MSRRGRLGGLNPGKLLQQGMDEATTLDDLPEIAGVEVRSVLGRGSTGIVLECWDNEHERTVAVKVLTPQHLKDGLLQERLMREGESMARLDHPHIVRVYDCIAAADGGAAVVMEMVSGPSLRHVLRDQGNIPGAEAVEWARQIASAMACVHAAGLTHRDLKPENLLVDEEGKIRVTDFGIAFSDDGEPRLTLTGMWLGTDGYMAPEQAEGNPVDARADVFSLGVIVYEMLLGRIPEGRVDRIQEQLSQFPEGTGDLLRHSLQPRAENRLGSMTAFEEKLSALTFEEAAPSGWWSRVVQLANKLRS